MPVSRAALLGLLAVSLHSQPATGGTKSLIVDGVDERASGFYVRMRNVSNKDLVGYSLTIGDGYSSVRVSRTPVVAARAASRVRIQDTTGHPRAGQLRIRAALFADGSYEGDAASAAALVIPGMASEVERKRIAMALESMIAKDETPPFAEVRGRISAVTTV